MCTSGAEQDDQPCGMATYLGLCQWLCMLETCLHFWGNTPWCSRVELRNHSVSPRNALIPRRCSQKRNHTSLTWSGATSLWLLCVQMLPCYLACALTWWVSNSMKKFGEVALEEPKANHGVSQTPGPPQQKAGASLAMINGPGAGARHCVLWRGRHHTTP